MAESLSPENVVPHLRGRFGHPYVYEEVCPSTQRLLGDEHAEGAAAVTEEQTEGRGRLGRQWHSPHGTGVLVSVLLEPRVETARLPELSLVAGEACADAIAILTGLAPAIKLPNDVLIGERKAAGILAEARDGRVVLGIGINANGAPQEVDGPATSLSAETGAEVDRVGLLVELLAALERHYDAWVAATAA